VRAVVFVVEVALALLLVFAVYRVVRPVAPAPPPPRVAAAGGRWRTHHYADAGQTVVSVARMTPAGEVLEEHVVDRIPDSDGDWSRRFLAARQEAEERAFHLNADET
jgi:hypothetical protein